MFQKALIVMVAFLSGASIGLFLTVEKKWQRLALARAVGFGSLVAVAMVTALIFLSPLDISGWFNHLVGK